MIVTAFDFFSGPEEEQMVARGQLTGCGDEPAFRGNGETSLWLSSDPLRGIFDQGFGDQLAIGLMEKK